MSVYHINKCEHSGVFITSVLVCEQFSARSKPRRITENVTSRTFVFLPVVLRQSLTLILPTDQESTPKKVKKVGNLTDICCVFTICNVYFRGNHVITRLARVDLK